MDILVKRDGAMGDVLLATPILPALRAAHGGARLFFETLFPKLLDRNPDVQGAAVRYKGPPSLWAATYDLNMAYERMPRMHAVDAYAQACGVSVSDRRPRLYPSADDRQWAASTLGQGRWAVMHPGPSHWPGRAWPAARFARVSEELAVLGLRRTIVGSGGDAIPCDLDLRGHTTPHQLAALAGQAALFVGIDAFPMHAALAAGAPVVALFGCIDPSTRLPGGPGAVGLTAPPHRVWCLGCHHSLPAPRTYTGCFRDRVWCMEELSEDDVLDAAVALMQRPGLRPVA